MQQQKRTISNLTEVRFYEKEIYMKRAENAKVCRISLPERIRYRFRELDLQRAALITKLLQLFLERHREKCPEVKKRA